MTMKHCIMSFLLIVALLAGSTAYGQTTLNGTTLSTAITDTNTTNLVVLASVGSGSTAVLAGHILFIDGEAMTVRTTPTTTTVSVIRHTNSTPGQTHSASSIVYYGPAQAFVSGKTGIQFYEGSCTASANLYLPIIDIVNTQIGDCKDGLWRWFRLSTMSSNRKIRHPVVDAAYTALLTDEIIAYTSLTATRAVTLPSATGLAGKIYIFKDESGSATTAGTVTITLVGTVNGSSNPTIINSAYGAYRLYSDGTAWFSW